MRIVIIGGGVIGMMQARELALAGCDVVLIERHRCGKEASWAGGGIISPLYPWRYSQPVTALATWSQEYYPNLVQTLEAESGIDPELTRTGLLVLAIEDRKQALAWSQDHSLWLEEIGQDRLYELEPGLRLGYESALFMPHVGSVRNPRLCQALRRVLAALPQVTVLENTEVRAINTRAGRFHSVTTGEEEISADICVVSAGAWSAQVLEMTGYRLPVEPVKGQMVAFQTSPGTVNRVVLSDGKYVIPRRDGLVLAGSTLEYEGFDKSATETAQALLVERARKLMPALVKAPVVEHWAGLRPGSPEGIPFIGEMPETEGLFVNTGHFRNGLVLAPAAVHLMTSLLLGQSTMLDPSPYAPQTRISRTVEVEPTTADSD